MEVPVMNERMAASTNDIDETIIHWFLYDELPALTLGWFLLILHQVKNIAGFAPHLPHIPVYVGAPLGKQTSTLPSAWHYRKASPPRSPPCDQILADAVPLLQRPALWLSLPFPPLQSQSPVGLHQVKVWPLKNA